MASLIGRLRERPDDPETGAEDVGDQPQDVGDPPRVETPDAATQPPQDADEDERRRWAKLVIELKGPRFLGYIDDGRPPVRDPRVMDPWGLRRDPMRDPIPLD